MTDLRSLRAVCGSAESEISWGERIVRVSVSTAFFAHSTALSRVSSLAE